MKTTILRTLYVVPFLFLMACEPKEEPQVIPESFPKKQLIEEFTGQGCGYCPYGMNFIHDFIENDTNFILVLHHDGYAADHFTVSESRTITKALKVSGAPGMTINRAKTAYVDENDKTNKDVVFHPSNLTTVDKSQFEQTTYASVVISNTYDDASRELKVHVSGLLCRDDHPDLHLTVLVKESGMIDTQADYFYTFEGWQEFRHTNAVRAVLTEAKGDPVTVNEKHQYEADYTVTLKSKWVPENCMVVAFLSEEFQPVVQAEQRPVVSGTKGGADLQHGGITPVAVPDYYPEPNATSGPADFSGNEAETITNTYAYYGQYPQYNITYWLIYLVSPSASISIKNTTCIPYGAVYLLAPYDESAALPTGRFPIVNTEEPGTVVAGYRNDELQEIGGSLLYFTSKTYYQQGYLNPSAEWLIADGEMNITDEGWSLTGHARNGADIRLVGSAPLQRSGAMSPVRRMAGRQPRFGFPAIPGLIGF